MNEGRIDDPSIAETYYDIATAQGEKQRGEKLSEEDIRDTDRAMSLLEKSDIDWDKFDIELSKIRELSPEDAKQKLNEVLSALAVSDDVDRNTVSIMQRIRSMWGGNKLPIAAAAAVIFMVGCQPKEKQVEAGSGPATIEQAGQKRSNENYCEFVNQDIVNQWVKEHTNLKGVEVIGADVHEDKTDDGVTYSADVKVKVTFPDGTEAIRYGNSINEVKNGETTEPQQRGKKYGQLWDDENQGRLNAAGDKEYVKSQVSYNAVRDAIIFDILNSSER